MHKPELERRNVEPTAISSAPGGSVPRQLFANQLWETVAFLAKAAFLVLLTPVMLGAWGSDGYGQFALASSAFVLLAALDCGIRPQLRIALCAAVNADDMPLYRFLICRALVSFAAVAVVACVALFAVSMLFGVPGVGSSGAADQMLLPTTVGMTLLVLLSGLLVEPLAAHGQLGSFKLANAAGSAVAIPAAYLALRSGAGPAPVVAAWLGALATANFVLFAFSRLRSDRFWMEMNRVRLTDVRATLQEGFWFGAINLNWLVKTHGLTFIVSQISGATAAGVFFILLRISEVIGTLCAVSSDAAIAVLALTRHVGARLDAFAQAYRYVLVLSSHAAVGIMLLGPMLLQLWLGDAARFDASTLAAVAAFGIASAFNRIITSAAVGLNMARTATRWGAVETALTLTGVGAAQVFFGMDAAFFAAAVAVGGLVPVAISIADRLGGTAARVWLQPLTSSVIVVGIGLIVWAIARNAGATPLLYAGGVATVISAAWQLSRVHASTELDVPASGIVQPQPTV